MADNGQGKTARDILLGAGYLMTILSCYWRLAPMISRLTDALYWFDVTLVRFREVIENTLMLKSFALAMITCSALMKGTKKTETTWTTILSATAVGVIVFFIEPAEPIIYTITSLIGITLCTYGISLIRRKLSDQDIPDDEEGFLQNEDYKENEYSINIPYTYVYKKRKRKGWICCVNPARASIVLGSPGSGKSFAVYNAFIEQTIRKQFTMFLYDYKFPDLTERVLTEIAYQKKHEHLWAGKGQKKPLKPRLYIINFDDPRKSNRCNPIHHSYITDPADTSEIADLVFLNINKGSSSKGFDFFNESAKVYLDAILWFLANYDPDAIYDAEGNVIGSTSEFKRKGIYCTFPHVIEMMSLNYKKTFQILQYTKGLEAKISPFSSALEGEAMEQLMGQVASAQIPMGKFVSPALYWVMSGDDFTLDINNPEEPKIVCMGNNPDRQTIYGTTLALYTSRMFKLINHKHKLKSVVLLDELPTIFIKGLDNLIATARSNKVCIVAGAQDKSQLKRDYGDKEAEVIFTTIGNCFAGSVEGQTARDISQTFGKEYRKKVSHSMSDNSDSRSVSYQLEDILPASKIVDMTQGTFCGWVKDNFGEEISRKKFYGRIEVDMKRNKKLEKEAQKVPIITNMFGDTTPQMSAADRERLSKLWPKLADKDKELEEKFIEEQINKIIMDNFNRIKEEVRELVEKEYARTTPMAEAHRAEMSDNC